MQRLTDCALLVAVPLTEDAFINAAQRGSDFVRAYAQALGADVRKAWAGFRKYAGYCRSIADEAAQAGVRVIDDATLSDFAEAMRGSEVVTLVAHARGPEVVTADILDAGAIAAQCRRVRQAINASAGDLTDGTAAGIASWLDRLIGPVERDPGADAADDGAWRAALYRARAHNRRRVEAMCPGALGGGPALELACGLHPLEDIVAITPDPFVITLDLTVCDSLLLAESIRAVRVSGVILANAQPASLDFRAGLYRETIRLMRRHSLSYVDAAVAVRRALE